MSTRDTVSTSSATRQTSRRPDRDGIVPLFLLLVAFRVVNALTITTFFQPDEYFQSLEPAWAWVFGEPSGAWITWEWRECLRSSIHPLLFTAVYTLADFSARILSVTPASRAELLIAAPKVLQAVSAATTDLFAYSLASKIWPSDSTTALAALVLTVASPWQWFCSVRTLSNSLETTLTIAALYYWPWAWLVETPMVRNPTSTGQKSPNQLVRTARSKAQGLSIALPLAAIACILRPTNIIIWATVSLTLIWQYSNLYQALILSRATVIYGSAVLSATVTIDTWYYGEFVFPPLRFLHFNVVRSLAEFYGTNRIDYYLTEGLPLLLTTTLPFAAIAIWRRSSLPQHQSSSQQTETARILHTFCITVGVSIGLLSTISHKEVRFIYPLLPILHILACEPLATFWRSSASPVSWRKLLLLTGLAVNIGIAYYAGHVHQRGVIDVVHYIRRAHEAKGLLSSATTAQVSTTSVAFLMPCHSTPWRSHLVHPEIDAWALTCEPPLHLSLAERAGYMDEADVFYANPAAWMNENMAKRESIGIRSSYQGSDGDSSGRQWPQYLAFFEQLESTLQSALAGSEYQECWRGFNTHWHDDWRRQGDVVVWCLRP